MDFQPVIFHDRIRKQIAANLVQRAFLDGTIQFQLDKFPHPHTRNPGNSVMADGIAHGDSLWIEDVLFRRHDDLGFHGAGD